MKKPLTLAVTVLCLSPALAEAAASRKPAPASGPNAAILEVGRSFASAANAKDTAKLAALYVEDAILMPPNQELVRGRAAIQAFWQGILDSGARDVSLSSTGLFESGSIAYETGTYQFTIAPAQGPAVTDRGKYLVGLRRDAGGKWRMQYDIFNSDLPCPAGGAAPGP